MVRSSHESMHRIFGEDFALFAKSSPWLDVLFAQPRTATPLPTDVTEFKVLERRVDLLLDIEGVDGTSYVLAVEAQGRKDMDKSSSWAYYAAYLQAKYRKPPVLLVVCQDESTARWAERPMDLGPPQWPTLTLRPLVLGPHNLPLITDPTEVQKDVSFAVLSAMVHGRNPQVEEALRAIVSATKDAEEAPVTFLDILELGLVGTPAAQIWEILMTMDTSMLRGSIARSLREEGQAQGQAQGQAWALLRLLEFRKVEVTAAERERITACMDPDVVERWYVRAFTAERGEDIFTEG
ncbi:hypothetical protein [Streptomyces sp. HPF1205]|uniref:hypothetical protein n=1 Tax=Streptomyces sp. HPF1205 TaxID=2873262 RepID=UPI001CECA7DF|nr:hypothetical protein [Streptomyces sp. HPF1205]